MYTYTDNYTANGLEILSKGCWEHNGIKYISAIGMFILFNYKNRSINFINQGTIKSLNHGPEIKFRYGK